VLAAEVTGAEAAVADDALGGAPKKIRCGFKDCRDAADRQREVNSRLAGDGVRS
jgi:hypothetical protein